jgi:Phage integrase SAM-like domain
MQTLALGAAATRSWVPQENGAGERVTFAQLCDEFLLSHTSTLSVSTQRNHQTFSKTLKTFFKDRRLAEINQRVIEEYRDYRRHQSSKRNPKKTVKGATVNRALENLQCMFEFAVIANTSPRTLRPA